MRKNKIIKTRVTILSKESLKKKFSFQKKTHVTN